MAEIGIKIGDQPGAVGFEDKDLIVGFNEVVGGNG